MDNNKIDTYVQQITDLNTDVKGYEVKSILEDVFNDGVKKSKSLNKTDLQRHAAEVGIIPIDNKENLQKRLLGEFVKHTASYRIPRVKHPVQPLSQKAKDILAEGR